MNYDYWDYPYEMATKIKKLNEKADQAQAVSETIVDEAAEQVLQKPHGELIIKLHAIANSLRRLAMQLEEGVYKDAVPK